MDFVRHSEHGLRRKRIRLSKLKKVRLVIMLIQGLWALTSDQTA